MRALACRGDWFTSRNLLIVARRDVLVSDFAAGELARRTGKIIKQSKKLEVPDTRGRHKLRIAIRKVFTTTLKGIQSGLSRLNDMQVHCRLAHRFAHSRSGVPNQTEKAFAIGLLTSREHAEAAAVLADAVKAARKISDIKPF